MRRHWPIWMAAMAAVPVAGVRAGMPATLPTGFDASSVSSNVESMMRLEPEALSRLFAISFFVICFFLSAWGFQFLWNYVQGCFPALPRLSYARSVAVVFLWGMLFVVVLTMISGARELMTPGAWQKQGYTYKLAKDKEDWTAGGEAARRAALEKLRTALWQHAAIHQGKFPKGASSAIADHLWEIPGTARVRFHYVEGRTAGYAPVVLAYEAELDPRRRLALLANGDIVAMTTAEIDKAAK